MVEATQQPSADQVSPYFEFFPMVPAGGIRIRTVIDTT
jgi:hypothetical protein